MAKKNPKNTPEDDEEGLTGETMLQDHEGVSMEETFDIEHPKGRKAHWGRSNMSAFEMKVWRFLGKEDNPWGFLPQVSLYGYLVDFYSPNYRFVLEADGPFHLESQAEDQKRDADLKKHGIRTLRLQPVDFVRNTPQQLFELLEYEVHPARVVEEGEDEED